MRKQPKDATVLDMIGQQIEILQHVQSRLTQAQIVSKKKDCSKKYKSTAIERYMQSAISGIAKLDSEYWNPLSAWWKLEYFKRQWASGFCFVCQGDGKQMEDTGDPKHPLQAKRCSECHGRGRVRPRKPRGEMIFSGQESLQHKARK